MEIFLVRHTRPRVQKGFIYGRYDVPLADSFEAEAVEVLEKLPKTVDAVYSSPSARCLALAQAYSKDVLVDDRLYELDFGLWESQSWDTIDRSESEYWMGDFLNRCPPNGETLNQMNARVMSFWSSVLNEQADTVTIFCHAGVIRIILSHFRNLPLQSMFDISVSFGEVIHLQV